MPHGDPGTDELALPPAARCGRCYALVCTPERARLRRFEPARWNVRLLTTFDAAFTCEKRAAARSGRGILYRGVRLGKPAEWRPADASQSRFNAQVAWGSGHLQIGPVRGWLSTRLRPVRTWLSPCSVRSAPRSLSKKDLSCELVVDSRSFLPRRPFRLAIAAGRAHCPDGSRHPFPTDLKHGGGFHPLLTPVAG